MIDLYTWPTPNGHKAAIMLEETGLEYRVHPVDIANGEQFAAEYEAINPNGKIPTIVDQEGPGGGSVCGVRIGRHPDLSRRKDRALSVRRPAPALAGDPVADVPGRRGRADVRAGAAFPPFCTATAALCDPALFKGSGAALRRARTSVWRRASSWREAEYSIADIATYPWVARHEWQGVALRDYPNVRRWVETVGHRPAVQRGMQVPRV